MKFQVYRTPEPSVVRTKHCLLPDFLHSGINGAIDRSYRYLHTIALPSKSIHGTEPL
jgi:hypothetical protein